MAFHTDPVFATGIWGPYFGILPNLWLLEGGLSASGSLVDFVIRNSSAYPRLAQLSSTSGKSVYEILNDEVAKLGAEEMKNVHMLGYHHGNRSPRADPSLRGMVSGLSLADGLAEIAKMYLAAIESIAYGTRHIIEVMNDAGHCISQLSVCGGGAKNPLWVQTLADATRCQVVLATEDEAMLLGCSMMAATASGHYASLQDAMVAMATEGRIVHAQKGRVRAYHDAKYRVYHEMYLDFIKYRNMMEAV